MNIELNETETEMTLQLIALGHYIISIKNDNKPGEDYDTVARKIMREYLKDKVSPVLMDKQIEFSMERFLEKARKHLDRYEELSFTENLAKMLADRDYPIKEEDDESCGKNYRAEEIYQKELTEKGVEVLSINVPDFEEKSDVLANEFEKDVQSDIALARETALLYLKAVSSRIKELMAQYGFTPEKLCEASNVSLSDLESLLSGAVNLADKEALHNICEGFQISVQQFYASEVFKPVYESEFFQPREK